MEDVTTRHLDLEGLYNFRDLGGYRAADGRAVRWGRLYRSDALHHLTERDAVRARDELGLRTTIDLRTEAEVEAYPEPVGLLPRRHHLPFLATLKRSEDAVERVDRGPEATAERYLRMLEGAGGRVAEAVRILAEPEALPAVFYCAVGKDRTGILAAVVLGLLGVPDTEIIRDYTLTSHGVEDVIERLRRSDVYGPGIHDTPTPNFHPHPDSMALVLRGLEADHGSIEGYVRANGVTIETIEALRDALLEG